MNEITAITTQQKNKDRCNIFIDGQFAFATSLEIVMRYRLKVGEQVSKADLQEIVLENDKIQAFDKAITYISKSLKTKKQVKEYLLRKGYSEQVVFNTIDKLKDYNLIDDAEYSKRYIESNAKTQGKRLFEYKLMMKGVKKSDIELGESEVEIDYNSNAKAIADKYLKHKEITKENIAKAYRYLIGKGFSYDQADCALKNYKEEF